MIEGYIAHISQGRIRLKFPDQKGNEDFFILLSDRISQSEEVRNVKTNPLTGSILLEHERQPEDIINLLKNLNLFQIIESKNVSKTKLISSVKKKNIGYLNRIIIKLSSETLDLKSTVLLFLIISAIYQIARGNLSAIPWYTALFYLSSLISKD